jgi:hypothetical protein
MEDAARGLRLPGLELLLGKGAVADSGSETPEGWLFRRFGVQRRGDWPVAALTLLADGADPGRGFWMRADPVSLRADGARLVLADSAAFRISAEEAGALAQALSRHFRDDGLEFRPLRPQRWYLRLPSAPALVCRAPREAAGRHVDEFLPAGPDALHWHRLMNEAQMLLHRHPVNEAREERGEPPVNSVWPWGAGRLPDAAAATCAAAWSDEPLATGLARLAGVECRPLPPSAALWLQEAAGGGEALAVLDELGAAARGGGATWREALQALEKSWFAPLAEALRSRRLARLAVSCPGAERSRELVVEAGDFRKFWRGPKPLA